MAVSTASMASSRGKSPLCCCPLFFAELKSLPFWSLREVNGNVVSLQASFAPLPRIGILLIKLFLFAWCFSILIIDIEKSMDDFDYYFIFLTNWGFLAALIYFLFSLLNTVFGVGEQPASGANPGVMVRFAWGLFAATSTNQLLLSILFWVIEYKRGEPVTYSSLMKHGIIAFLVLFEGLIVNRIPVRAKHFLFVFLFDILYVTWSVIHSLLGLGNPFREDNDQSTDDDSIYPVTNWKERPLMATIVTLGSLFVAAPLLFYLVWGLSLWSCPFGFHGANRRFVTKDIEQGSSYSRMRE